MLICACLHLFQENSEHHLRKIVSEFYLFITFFRQSNLHSWDKIIETTSREPRWTKTFSTPTPPPPQKKKHAIKVSQQRNVPCVLLHDHPNCRQGINKCTKKKDFQSCFSGSLKRKYVRKAVYIPCRIQIELNLEYVCFQCGG